MNRKLLTVKESENDQKKRSHIFRRFTWRAGLAVLALVLLSMYETARAAIIFTDTSNLTTPWFNNGAGTDGPFSASNAFTVTAAPGTSVLVVPFDEYASSGTAGIAASTNINWVTSGGTQQLQRAVIQVSANG